jgi:tetratricopeptide (TPR) repeat protein
MKKYLFNQAILLISQDKYDEAIQLFKAILEYEKKNYDALFFSGVCYGKIGKHKNAITFLKKAFNINPSYDCYLNLGKAFLEEKKFRDSISLISEGLRKFPNDYRLMLNIANAYLNLNDR